LIDAHKHILLDLADTSDGNAITELEKIVLRYRVLLVVPYLFLNFGHTKTHTFESL